ncbi:hypothetical protein A0U42_01535 [Megasphaera sp. DISK 18]|nr:hypothetical protein A0U42_01535 [Megasphaera sp. DISK 18]
MFAHKADLLMQGREMKGRNQLRQIEWFLTKIWDRSNSLFSLLHCSKRAEKGKGRCRKIGCVAAFCKGDERRAYGGIDIKNLQYGRRIGYNEILNRLLRGF